MEEARDREGTGIMTAVSFKESRLGGVNDVRALHGCGSQTGAIIFPAVRSPLWQWGQVRAVICVPTLPTAGDNSQQTRLWAISTFKAYFHAGAPDPGRAALDAAELMKRRLQLSAGNMIPEADDYLH